MYLMHICAAFKSGMVVTSLYIYFITLTFF